MFLELFIENLLMDKKHELKNKYMHTDFENECVTQSASSTIPKCKNCTLEELAIIQEIAKNPVLTQKELEKDWYFCVGFGVAWQHFLKVVHGGYDKIGGDKSWKHQPRKLKFKFACKIKGNQV